MRRRAPVIASVSDKSGAQTVAQDAMKQTDFYVRK
jgi:hypothetical protein